MEMEIEELKRQRDLAQSQVDELRRKLEEDQQVSLPPSSLLVVLTEKNRSPLTIHVPQDQKIITSIFIFRVLKQLNPPVLL